MNEKILTAAGPEAGQPTSPLVRKLSVELPPPSLDDHRGQRERLVEALDRSGEPAAVLSPSALKSLLGAAGWVTVLQDTTGRVLGVEPGASDAPAYGLAIDLGSTTAVVELCKLSGEVVGRAAGPNRQAQRGEDLLTRIQVAELEGTEGLRALALESLNPLIRGLAAEAGIAPTEIVAAAVAGNPTMIHLLLGLDPTPLSREPYAPMADAPDPWPAGVLGLELHPEAPVYFLPGIGAFVGGDVLGGLLASGLHRRAGVGVLVDVGTNGEIILGNRDWLVAGAGAAGPAFEGGAVKAGMRAEAGAIEALRINPITQAVNYRTIGGGVPRGICGSGLIDAVAELFLAGLVDRAGHFREGDSFQVVGPAEAAGGRAIVLDQEDLLTFIRTKAGMMAALDLVLGRVGLTASDIEVFYLAGAIANYLDLEQAIAIGLLPDLPRERFVNLGNGSLWGARLALLHQEARAELVELRTRIHYLELNVEGEFMNLFTPALFLPHTDLDRFPTIRDRLEGQGP